MDSTVLVKIGRSFSRQRGGDFRCRVNPQAQARKRAVSHEMRNTGKCGASFQRPELTVLMILSSGKGSYSLNRGAPNVSQGAALIPGYNSLFGRGRSGLPSPRAWAGG